MRPGAKRWLIRGGGSGLRGGAVSSLKVCQPPLSPSIPQSAASGAHPHTTTLALAWLASASSPPERPFAEGVHSSTADREAACAADGGVSRTPSWMGQFELARWAACLLWLACVVCFCHACMHAASQQPVVVVQLPVTPPCPPLGLPPLLLRRRRSSAAPPAASSSRLPLPAPVTAATASCRSARRAGRTQTVWMCKGAGGAQRLAGRPAAGGSRSLPRCSARSPASPAGPTHAS